MMVALTELHSVVKRCHWANGQFQKQTESGKEHFDDVKIILIHQTNIIKSLFYDDNMKYMNQSIKKRSTYIFSLKTTKHNYLSFFLYLEGGAEGATVRMERLDL